MSEFLQSPAALWVYRLTALAVLVAAGLYVISRIRAGRIERPPSASDLMSEFRDLHRRGELSDEEFKTIKGTLAGRLQREIKDAEHKG
jgi:hypothetical protein